MTTMRFGFEKKWERFIKNNFSEERIEISQRHLLNFLELHDLSGKYFLNIGCGSGLQSLATLRSGAKKIVSFDYEPDSVQTTNRLREYAGNPDHWELYPGSILDKEILNTIEPAESYIPVMFYITLANGICQTYGCETLGR